MKELAEFLIRKLADNPEQALVEESDAAGTVTFKLVVADEDKGRIIGKKGKVIRAIRALVAAAGAKDHKKTMVEID